MNTHNFSSYYINREIDRFEFFFLNHTALLLYFLFSTFHLFCTYVINLNMLKNGKSSCLSTFFSVFLHQTLFPFWKENNLKIFITFEKITFGDLLHFFFSSWKIFYLEDVAEIDFSNNLNSIIQSSYQNKKK